MVKRMKSLVYFELNITLDNKLVLVYTLLFPIIFLLFNREDFLADSKAIYGYWAYILVTGTLNGIIAGTITMRETNFFKMFSYIAKSKTYVFLANLIAQMIILELELLFFNIFAMFLKNDFMWQQTIYCFVISVLFIPLCAIMLSFFLIIRMKQNTYNVMLNSYLLFMLVTAFANVDGWLQWLIVAINPFVFFANMYNVFAFAGTRITDLVALILLGLIYTAVGTVCLKKMPVRGIQADTKGDSMIVENFDYKHIKNSDWIFKNLNIEFSDHKINVLTGPNGAGKSTLLDCIADVDNIRNDSNFKKFPSKEMIAYQLQGVPFIGEVTVGKTIELMLQIDGMISSMPSVPEYIKELYKKKMGDLSGGQRRLVIIYGLSLLDRSLYLFDEPESGLDPEMSRKVIELIEDISNQRKKVIMTTHQFSNIKENHKLFFLANQTCLFSGTVSKLMDLTKASEFSKVYERLRAQ